ncbi:putative gluconokinase [Nymphaea thermarum]|nr:putative gluconokinase [Nymphaea thermarum]
MGSDLRGLAIVIMGVSGSGKSTIGALLARNVCSDFLDADDFHSVENKEKMRNGVPLTDEDRFPWLETISNALTEKISGGKTVVLCCSALQFRYREILRKADPNNGSDSVKFFCLMAPIEVIEGRMKQRESDGNHFMPAALLQSQIDLLEIHEDEGIHVLDATLSPDAIVARIQASLS